MSRQTKAAEQRVAMSYEFEDLLKNLEKQKDRSQQQTEAQRMQKLNQILSQTMKSFQLNINGNQTTKYDFIKDEINVTTPATIDDCSIQIFDGINVCRKFLNISSMKQQNSDCKSNHIYLETERGVRFD